MPKGPRREKRPAEPVPRAIRVAKITTGDRGTLSSAAAELGRKGGKARAAAMTAERRVEIARKAAATRWAKASVVAPRSSNGT